jgi:Ca-activated chloride channel family protein
MKRWHFTAGLSVLAGLAAALVPTILARVPLPSTPDVPPPPEVPRSEGGPLALIERLDQSAVAAEGVSERYVVVEVSAPDDDSGTRRPVHLAVVLDTSGSMSGRDKIAVARMAARELVDELRPADSFALVGFSDSTRTYIHGASADGDKKAWGRIIDGIDPSGGTNLHDGVATGFAELEAMDGAAVDRLVVLSDGMANVGVTDPGALRTLAASHTAEGITVSTLGLGLDFNEDLLAAMSDAGGGTYAFVDRPGELGELLHDELAAMATVAGRHAVVDVAMSPGVELVDVYAPSAEIRGDGFRVFLGDVHAGERRKIVARVRVSAGATGAMPVSTAHLDYVRAADSHPAIADGSVTAEVTADLARIDRSVDVDAGKHVMRAVSGAGLQAAANAYGQGKGREAQRELDDGRKVLSSLGSRYKDLEGAAELDGDLGAAATRFDAAPSGSADGLYLAKKAKEEARELRSH